MKPVARRPPRTRSSNKRLSPKPIVLPAGVPPPPGYTPYPPPPHPTYYYPYPYPPPPPPPPYQHQYTPAPMPPLRPPSRSSTVPPPPPPPPVPVPVPLAQAPQKKKNATTESSTKSQPPPRLVSTSGRESNPSQTTKASVRSSAEGTIIPHENDVLMGRGGKNNTHIGNEKLREMARAMREVYIKSRKKDKTNMARQLVQQVFALDPPGRFLQRDPVTMVWEEVDLDTARHKTSQCLRDAASEKSSYTKIHRDDNYNHNRSDSEDEQQHPPQVNAEPGAEEDETAAQMQVDTVDSATQTPMMLNRPATPEQQQQQQQSTLAVNNNEDMIKRAMTPVVSNLAHKIEPSPLQPPQPIEPARTSAAVRTRLESWESGNIARNLIESWDDNNGSFMTRPLGPRHRGSMDNSSRHRMYTWMAASINGTTSYHDVQNDMDMEDAVLIPPEELDGAADEDGEPFSLLDVTTLEEEEMQIWDPDMCDESESPFDTEFFY